MNVLGHGVDVVDLPRLRRLLLKSDDFVMGWFTTTELEELGSRVQRADVIGGRVAAKEAVSKAIGTGFDAEVAWHDIEISSDHLGPPTARLSGGAAEAAERLGVTAILLSISHTHATAVASAIALG